MLIKISHVIEKYTYMYSTLDKTVLEQCFTTKNWNKQSDMTNFVIVLINSLNSTHGKIFLYGSHKKGLHYTLSKFGNRVTKYVKSRDLWEMSQM